MKRLLLIIFVIVGIVAAVYFYQYGGGKTETPVEQQNLAASQMEVQTGKAVRKDSLVPGNNKTTVDNTRNEKDLDERKDLKLQQFKDKFGKDLVIAFDERGRLASVKGKMGSNMKADEGFTPDDPQKAIKRAKEILEAAGSLIGLNSSLPLGDPRVKTGNISAQVYFQEFVRDVPVAPVGNITVDLGPEGELIGLYSDYNGDLKVGNSFRIDSSQAKDMAVSAAITNESTGLKTEGGSRVIWTNGNEGRCAYDFTVGSRQVIVDAETGKVIFQRDRRM